MERTQHTPGPLRYEQSQHHAQIYLIDYAAKDPKNAPHYAAMGEVRTTEADARRLVACWNACQGISTETLEGGVLAEMRAVLAEAECWMREYGIQNNDDGAMGMFADLRAVLAKLKG